jgi:hypothetical protein
MRGLLFSLKCIALTADIGGPKQQLPLLPHKFYGTHYYYPVAFLRRLPNPSGARNDDPPFTGTEELKLPMREAQGRLDQIREYHVRPSELLRCGVLLALA